MNDKTPLGYHWLTLPRWTALNVFVLASLVLFIGFTSDPLLILVVVPPIMFVQIIWFARLDLELGESADMKGEVECLLQKKRTGTILRGSRQPWDDAERMNGLARRDVVELEDDATGTLDQLLTRKRAGHLGLFKDETL